MLHSGGSTPSGSAVQSQQLSTIWHSDGAVHGSPGSPVVESLPVPSELVSLGFVTLPLVSSEVDVLRLVPVDSGPVSVMLDSAVVPVIVVGSVVVVSVVVLVESPVPPPPPPHALASATAAIRESGGSIDIVTDEEILAAQQWLAAHEGIFVEPASAASIAGLFKCHSPARCASCPFPQIPAGSRIVCTVTGHGLKDPDIARERCGSVLPCKAEKSAILGLIG